LAYRRFYAFEWEGKYYYYNFLPMGASSSPGYFCWFTEQISQILSRCGVPNIAYVDDFLLVIAIEDGPTD